MAQEIYRKLSRKFDDEKNKNRLFYMYSSLYTHDRKISWPKNDQG